MASPQDVDIVRLAAARYRYEAHRLAEARERFGLSGTQLWQRVNALLDDPAVALAAPVEVNRLRRQRDARQRFKRAG